MCFVMYLISDQAWREAIALLTAYRTSAVDRDDLRGVNSRRRAGLLVRKLSKAKHIPKELPKTENEDVRTT